MTIRYRFLVAVATVGFAGLALVPPGCDRPPPPTKAARTQAGEDELAEIRDLAGKEHNVERCKQIVGLLNSMLAREGAPKPIPATAADREFLAKQINLTDEEVSEVVRDEFTLLDAHYLDECFFFHDAIRSLDMDFSDASDAKQLERAIRAYAWTMREVYPRDVTMPLAPPAYALRRGSGSTPERVAVALAMFQMLGLEACLIGQNPTSANPQMWAIGVHIGGKIYLFDPYSGTPMRKPDGKNVATLADIKANPDLIKTQAERLVPKVEPKQLAAGSEICLAPALSAMSVRMQSIREILSLSPPFLAGVDAKALKASFEKTGEKVSFWNPPKPPGGADRMAALTPILMLAYFQPPVEGGFDRGNAESQALNFFQRTLFTAAPEPDILSKKIITGAPALRLYAQFHNRFVLAAMGNDEPRIRVLRGQFDSAANELVDRRTTLQRILDRANGDPKIDEEAAEWAVQMAKASAELSRAEKNTSISELDLQRARNHFEELSKPSSAEKVLMQIERAAGPPMDADLSYQLALCKHEQAERLANRPGVDANAIRDAWSNAVGWWDRYLSNYSSRKWIQPGQIAQAKMLLAEARSDMERPAAK